ncbi:Hpt domain-containing protein [Mycetocola zhadangensis]|uniref:Hpt domain-containing protein n=1 Tax=Mycetocola zhadangensis TaxID=1164595 RepID=UPI003A4D7A94
MVTFPPNGPHSSLAGHLPLFDGTALDALLESLDNDRGAVADFVAAFVEQWPLRLARIDDRIRAGDAEGAVTAVLSLKVSSQMIGTNQLTSLCLELERIVREGDFTSGMERVETLRVVGAETRAALEVQRTADVPAQVESL